MIAAADANHDGKLSQTELPPPWQPTGTWRAIDLDRDGFLNEREWTFFRTRRASRNGLMAVKHGGGGDVTDTHVMWRFEKSLPDVPAPLVYKDVVFLVRSGGIATTLDAQSGKVLKQARLTGALEDYYASPIGVDGKVYVASEHGKVVVLRAAGDWEIQAINEFDSDIYATPAISDGQCTFGRDACSMPVGRRIRAGRTFLLARRGGGGGLTWVGLGDGFQSYGACGSIYGYLLRFAGFHRRPGHCATDRTPAHGEPVNVVAGGAGVSDGHSAGRAAPTASRRACGPGAIQRAHATVYVRIPRASLCRSTT